MRGLSSLLRKFLCDYEAGGLLYSKAFALSCVSLLDGNRDGKLLSAYQLEGQHAAVPIGPHLAFGEGFLLGSQRVALVHQYCGTFWHRSGRILLSITDFLPFAVPIVSIDLLISSCGSI